MPVPGVQTLKIQVADTSGKPLALPAANESLPKLLESISNGSLQPGALPSFADRSLASLTGNYAATPGASFTEPAEMTEVHWNAVLMNNRALHGYYFDSKLGILVKASKRG